MTCEKCKICNGLVRSTDSDFYLVCSECECEDSTISASEEYNAYIMNTLLSDTVPDEDIVNQLKGYIQHSVEWLEKEVTCPGNLEDEYTTGYLYGISETLNEILEILSKNGLTN